VARCSSAIPRKEQRSARSIASCLLASLQALPLSSSGNRPDLLGQHGAEYLRTGHTRCHKVAFLQLSAMLCVQSNPCDQILPLPEGWSRQQTAAGPAEPRLVPFLCQRVSDLQLEKWAVLPS